MSKTAQALFDFSNSSPWARRAALLGGLAGFALLATAQEGPVLEGGSVSAGGGFSSGGAFQAITSTGDTGGAPSAGGDFTLTPVIAPAAAPETIFSNSFEE